jgi:hypothetical protein
MIEIIAIDPGSAGGAVSLCALNSGQVMIIDALPLAKVTRAELIEWCKKETSVITKGYVEKVAAQPRFDPKKKRRVSMGAKSAFTFGQNFERPIMALTAAGCRVELVQPKTWQKVVGLHYPAGSNGTEKKKMGRELAQSLFPNVGFRITNAIADALLIAEYGRRVHV